MFSQPLNLENKDLSLLAFVILEQFILIFGALYYCTMSFIFREQIKDAFAGWHWKQMFDLSSYRNMCKKKKYIRPLEEPLVDRQI